MDQLEIPSQTEWCERRNWFEERFNFDGSGGGYLLGEHAIALLIELQAVFCAGAYVTAVILACTIVDSHLREIELEENFTGGLKAAFEAWDDCTEGLTWLRLRRNSLIHFVRGRDVAVSVEDHWSSRAQHETDARRAIELVSKVLLKYPLV